MSVDEVIRFFDNNASAAARALNTTPHNIYRWRREGQIPRGRQYELQVKSRGALKADGYDPAVDYLAIARRAVSCA
jgi:hypothetical protein